ncbi:MAG: hypothetical protein VX834_01510 [Myxococcota bacterium]|nr:hypothetical protein [Myxococcota bacterium]
MHRYSALSACALAIFMLPALAWGGDTVLVLMPETEDSQLTRAGLEEELGHELRVHVAWVGPESSADSVAAALEQSKPKAVVLKGALAEKLYSEVVSSLHASPRRGSQALVIPPSVVITASHEASRTPVPKSVQLSGHVAGVTSFVSLRAITKAPVQRVGVVYRTGAEPFVQAQAELAAREKIELVARSVQTAQLKDGLAKRLHELIHDEKVDALWVLDDDVMLQAELIKSAWLPALREHAKPVVVNSPRLMNARAGLGMFAVLPDHLAIGVRAADKILDLRDENWRIAKGDVANALSVRKVLLLSVHRDHLALRSGIFGQMDQVIK